MAIPTEWMESFKEDFKARYKPEHQTPERWERYVKSNLPYMEQCIKDTKRLQKGIKLVKVKHKDYYTVYHLHSGGNSSRSQCSFWNTKPVIVVCETCSILGEKSLFKLNKEKFATECT